jgi:hypothetical protein
LSVADQGGDKEVLERGKPIGGPALPWRGFRRSTPRGAEVRGGNAQPHGSQVAERADVESYAPAQKRTHADPRYHTLERKHSSEKERHANTKLLRTFGALHSDAWTLEMKRESRMHMCTRRTSLTGESSQLFAKRTQFWEPGREQTVRCTSFSAHHNNRFLRLSVL